MRLEFCWIAGNTFTHSRCAVNAVYLGMPYLPGQHNDMENRLNRAWQFLHLATTPLAEAFGKFSRNSARPIFTMIVKVALI